MSRLLFILFLFSGCCIAQIAPLKHGHAHNDYIHERHLFEALENGFTSIEIDVFLHKGELKVSHVAVGLDKKKTIEQLYLDPVKKMIEQNGGSVYKGFSTPVIFMIDFKTGGVETYRKLKEVLKNYESIVTVYQGDSVVHQRAINVLISGSSPVNELLKEDSGMATVDAGVPAMDNAAAGRVITRFSSTWGNHFNWKGKGDMSSAERDKLDSLVVKAHEMKKQIRFYHIPDKPSVWRTLLDSGVDWINTDHLKEYRKFYEKEYRR